MLARQKSFDDNYLDHEVYTRTASFMIRKKDEEDDEEEDEDDEERSSKVHKFSPPSDCKEKTRDRREVENKQSNINKSSSKEKVEDTTTDSSSKQPKGVPVTRLESFTEEREAPPTPETSPRSTSATNRLTQHNTPQDMPVKRTPPRRNKSHSPVPSPRMKDLHAPHSPPKPLENTSTSTSANTPPSSVRLAKDTPIPNCSVKTEDEEPSTRRRKLLQANETDTSGPLSRVSSTVESPQPEKKEYTSGRRFTVPINFQRQPSLDDMCIVKTEAPLVKRIFGRPLDLIKNPFPSFSAFKRNLNKDKPVLSVDSEKLYELLDALSWSFSFQMEKMRKLTLQLLRDESFRDRVVLQHVLQQDYNVSIGDYEADNILQYAALFVGNDRVRNEVNEPVGNEVNESVGMDESATPFEDQPFSLILPHDISKSKWRGHIDKLAICKHREAANLAAANIAASGPSNYWTRKVSKAELKEFREAVKKRRPKREGVDVSVYKQNPSHKVVPLVEHSPSNIKATYESFNGRVYALE